MEKNMLAVVVLLFCSVPVVSALHSVTPEQIKEALQHVADVKSKTYNCSISIGFKNADMEVSAAAGVADFSSDRHITVDDAFAWGSGTKPLTGASIFKLISEGHFDLETPIHELLDPILLKLSKQNPNQGFKSLGDLWGDDNVRDITVGQMLNMTSGIPDFDTAKGHGIMSDSLRAELYKNPGKIYTPTELMSVPWVAHKYRPCEDHGPYWHKCYSSTNFMLLGILLANGTKWNEFDQSQFLPASLKDRLKFAVTGAPSDYTPVHGYDRTSYNMPEGEKNDQDVSSVDGVFAGWTASDVVGTPAAMAALTWAIYGPNPTVLPKQCGPLSQVFKLQEISRIHTIMHLHPSVFENRHQVVHQCVQAYSDMMAKTALDRDYGYATFNLERDTGQSGVYKEAYGHLGATYGYQSQLVYFPALKFAMAVASNIESNSQTQPKDALCFAYNAVAGLLLQKDIHCTFHKSSYYGSGCNCTRIESMA